MTPRRSPRPGATIPAPPTTRTYIDTLLCQRCWRHRMLDTPGRCTCHPDPKDIDRIIERYRERLVLAMHRARNGPPDHELPALPVGFQWISTGYPNAVAHVLSEEDIFRRARCHRFTANERSQPAPDNSRWCRVCARSVGIGE